MENLPLIIRAAVAAALGVIAVVILTLRRRKRARTDLGLWASRATPRRAESGTISQVQ